MERTSLLFGGLLVTAIIATVITILIAPWSSVDGFDEEEARKFAALSAVTYCQDTKQILNWNCKACKEAKTPLVRGKIRVIDGAWNNATRVIIGKLKHKDGCLMAFRGTISATNWAENLQFLKAKLRKFGFLRCRHCKVHSGFFNAWKDVQHRAIAALREVGCKPSWRTLITPGLRGDQTVESNQTRQKKNNLVYVTGHSKGAALAQLAMFSLSTAGYQVAETYTFNAPRVGNRAFASQFNRSFSRRFPVYRINHHRDPVVHLPPAWLGFEHVPTEVYYDKDGAYRICKNNWDRQCSHKFANFLRFNANDHCTTPLLKNGNFCDPVGCAEPVTVRKV